MDWFILGIEPTKDKKAITDAYRQKLRQTNPEDKPEEFKALRNAYEEAIALADQADTEPVRDESPVGLWMRAIEELYSDYAARIDPALWKERMGSDVCIGLDTRPAAEEALLKFLMENYHLPRAVWQVLDGTFQFSARAEELYETWPRDFIDHAVLAGIRFEPSLAYELFTPGVNGRDCDAYRRLYFQANQAPLEEIDAILAQMDGLTERHPYGEALRYRLYMETGREQEGKDGFRQLAEAYPDNDYLVITWAEICMRDGNWEEAECLASRILQNDPQAVKAQMVHAQYLAEKQQYHEAKECGYEIYRLSGENPMLLEQIVELIKVWNRQLICQREAAYEENPADINNMIELAWCYSQNDRMDAAMELAKKIDPDYEDAYAYHNLLGKLYHNCGKFEDALPHLQAAETVLRNTADDGTKETRKRLARLPEMLQIQGNCLAQLGRPAEAKEKFQQALELAPEDTEVLSLMGKILFATGDYAYAVDIFRRLLALSPGAMVAELLMVMCLYRSHQDKEAFEAADHAIAVHGNDLTLYLIKAQILIRNQRFQDAREILDFLRENDAPADVAMDFIQAELTDLEQKDTKSAYEQYRALQQRVEAGENLLWSSELYYRLAILAGNRLDISKEADRKTVMDLIDKGLEYQDQDGDLLRYKAWILKKCGLQEDAIAMYQALMEKYPQSDAALQGIAEAYYADLSRYAAQALTYYEKLLETRKTAELYFYAATCKRQLGDAEGARVYYLKELEMDPEDIDAFQGLALLCDRQGKYDESLKLLDQGLAIMEEYDRAFDPMVEHKAQILRRMGRFAEALAFLADAEKRYRFDNVFQLSFDICCQAGWWDRAKQVLQAWKQANRNDPDLMVAAGRLHLLQGKLLKATFAMAPAKHKLPYRQIHDFRLQLAELEQNYARQAELLNLQAKYDPTDDHTLSLLALAYWHMGKTAVAKGAALKALALLDKTLTQNLTDEPLYRSRRSLMLAILGRAEEARAELANTRKLPLCHFCEYGSCKDADIYEAQIEEILGNTDKAQQLFDQGRAKWPDDLDFLSGQRRLKKKGRK
ncbi:MAG: tetratricopeptide repeat protein [Ruminococcaceae bacterium]|nr:tetratricopeptide repeat protein [Oscillospiraceae bacterium]